MVKENQSHFIQK